ncbi:uncharacterized protein LOC142176735 [Nicotiana tabacum]|uniref:Uncharacterized protein LOC142176735 n=1 Tax=Nicotiana tabacum TaxID=4097 RepID=A0AC58TV21_TOBAC
MRLGIETVVSNVNGKIWLFLDSVVQWDLVSDTDQELTIKVYHQDIGKHIMMTFAYAKCSSLDILELWDNLYYLARDMELPWVVGGDFNVVLNEEEKIGGLPVYPLEYEDFTFCVNSCGLFDMGYKGSPFTWWNGRPNAECIFNRLERVFINLPFQTLFSSTKVEHHIRTGSNHAPLLMSCGDQTMQIAKPFKQKLQLKRIQNNAGTWIDSQETIASAAGEYYQRQFTQEDEPSNFDMLNNVPTMMVSLTSSSKLEKFLPSLISSNQSGFVKGRSIFENIILTQEIVIGIRLRGKPTNVVFKLDIANAYDRVSLRYLMHVLRKMGFVECFINMVWNLISNNWYSILINGQATNFFHSTRGVKQGDPLSPALFIFSAEVLSRSLNKLFEDKSFIGYGMPKWTEPLNHLAYADDTIIFASADQYSIQKIVDVLNKYEQTSGQLINKAKTSYYMHSNTAGALFDRVGALAGFSKGEFPFTYLGCLIFYKNKKKKRILQ